MNPKKLPYFILLLLAGLGVTLVSAGLFTKKDQARAAEGEYVVLSWNDLGMHCYNRNFENLAVLPPYNSLWAQVIKVGDPPQIVTEGVNVSYSFPDNTYSVGKSNFWQYDQQLFGVDLAPNIGLTGKGLSGKMDKHDDHFSAEGIPLTEFSDSDLQNAYPYQLAEVVVTEQGTNKELTRSTVVAPVSTEMNCDDCHYDGGVEHISTGNVETNILTLHDEENMDEYPAGHRGALMDRRPILCAECHASNALGASGVQGVPNLSKAIHEAHKEKVPSTIEGCYKCHPGPQTQCLRDVMSTEHNMECRDCHGDLQNVSENSSPWLKEPRCDNAACHGSAYQQDQALYRMSKEHGGIYCAGCHDSPHAIAPGREANDGIKFIDLQGVYDTLQTCTVCHTTPPAGAGPHSMAAPQSVSMVKGWNMISSYIQPQDPAIPAVFNDIEGQVNIVKNGDGQAYWPALNIDQIKVWSSEDGYQVNTAALTTLFVKGSSINPTQTPINLLAGWNLISYLRSSSMAVGTAVAGINNSLTIIKDGNGNVYWPAMNINTIGQMQPGQGYQVYMKNAAQLLYPGN